MTAKAILKVGACRGEDHNPLIGNRIQQQVKQLQRGWVDPVQVFVDQQHWPVLALLNQQVGQSLHGMRPLLGWRQFKGAVTRGSVQTHHLRDQLKRVGGLTEQRLQLVQPGIQPVRRCEPGGESDLLNDRIER